MQIIVDSNDKAEHIRLVLPLLMELAGIPLGEDAPAEAAALIPPPPPPPPLLPAAAAPAGDSSNSSTSAAPSATAAASLTNLPPPPPPPSQPTAAATVTTAEASTSAPSAQTAAGATSVASAPEFDSAGLPWDGRIHQARKGVKKDGTWKIQKGADPTLVENVVKELLARKGVPTPAAAQVDAFPATTGSAPPPPPAPPVSLPAGSNPVPVPPVSVASDVSIVIPAAQAPVPVPAAPAVGAVPASGFRELIAKISAGTKANKLDPVKVSTIVQRHGCPSLQALRDMPHLIPLVETDIDVEVLS